MTHPSNLDGVQKSIPTTKHLVRTVGVFAPQFPPAFRGGGPIRSIDALVANAPSKWTPLVLTSNRDLGETETLPVVADAWVPRGAAKVWYVSTRSVKLLLTGMNALRREQPILLYFNSFFSPTASILPMVLGRFGFWDWPARVLAPRGEFGVGALSRRPLKKKVYIYFFKCLGLHRGLIWHATSPDEVDDIRRHWGTDAKIVLRQNDTLLPPRPDQPTRSSEVLRAVFLGRIVEHKGLEVILRALEHVPGPFQLDVYGAEEDVAYVAKCRKLASKMVPSIKVTFHGAVPADNVRDVLRGFDILLMPTAGENFGHVIAEALSVSCPVFATPWTPWSDILNAGGGRVIKDRTPQLWADLILELQTANADERRELRMSAGRAYEAWASTPESPHLFDLVAAHLHLGVGDNASDVSEGDKNQPRT